MGGQTDDELLAVVRSAFPRLVRWPHEHKGVPEAGSDLERDDQHWQWEPLSNLASTSLQIARDSLDLLKLTIDSMKLFPSGTGPVLRQALLAGAQALWLTGPSDPDLRRERGLMVAEEDYRQQRIAQNELIDLHSPAGVDMSAHAVQVEHLGRRLQEVAALRTSKASLNATDIIRQATKILDPPTGSAGASSVVYWRLLGGDAHALGWQLFTQTHQWTEQYPDGTARARIEGSVRPFVEPYCAAWALFVKADDCFERLAGREGHSGRLGS